jgi:hypothetical protein
MIPIHIWFNLGVGTGFAIILLIHFYLHYSLFHLSFLKKISKNLL